jgi:hypothetical protein
MRVEFERSKKTPLHGMPGQAGRDGWIALVLDGDMV